MTNHSHAHCNIKRLSNLELLSQTKLPVQKERDIHIQVLRHFAEIESRKLFFKLGFSSLFDYATRELGYSEDAAYRRIQAMKLCKSLPETANRLQSGKISLSVASQLQVFFEKQDKEAKKQSLLKFMEREAGHGKPNQKSEEEKSLKECPGEEMLRKEGSHNKGTDQSVLKSAVSGEEKGSQNANQNANQIRPDGSSASLLSFSRKEKESLLAKVENCSTRKAEKLLSEASPSLSLLDKKEKVRFF